MPADQGTTMFIKVNIALAAAILMCGAFGASAATRAGKVVAHHLRPPRAQSFAPRYPQAMDPDSPEAAGGGSLGYNRNQYDDW
jgi:hypothetical protein